VKLCALDTSTPLASAALFDDGTMIASIERVLDRAHGEGLVPLLIELLGAASLTPAAVQRWAVGLGPGSFTGTRIADATVKGIVIATGAEVVGVSAFDAVSEGLARREGERIVVALDAMKGEVYVRADGEAPFFAAPAAASARLRELLGESPVVVAGAMAHVLTLGERARVVADAPHDVPHAPAIGRLGLRLAPGPVADLEPEYVRAAEVTRPAV